MTSLFVVRKALPVVACPLKTNKDTKKCKQIVKLGWFMQATRMSQKMVGSRSTVAT